MRPLLERAVAIIEAMRHDCHMRGHVLPDEILTAAKRIREEAPAALDTPDIADELATALRQFASLCDGPLDSVGGGTLIAPTIKVQWIKDARAVLRRYDDSRKEHA